MKNINKQQTPKNMKHMKNKKNINNMKKTRTIYETHISKLDLHLPLLKKVVL